MEKILEVNNISKKFGNKTILSEISFSIKKGESIGFLGPSGCGKTTLIRIIAKLEKEDSGHIKRNFENLSLVFQEDRLIPYKTIKQNFRFISDDETKIEKALTISGLKEYENSYPSQLSGGMRQRANFARIIFNQPQLILLDEPFQSLDLKTKDQIIKYFLKLKENFVFSTILVSHDVKEEVLLCDKIYFLSNSPTRIIKKLTIDKNQNIKSLFNEFVLKKEIEIIKSPYYI